MANGIKGETKGFDINAANSQCKKFWSIIQNENGLIKNADGTLSVYIKNANGIVSPTPITSTCCKLFAQISSEPWFYDLDSQKCRWSNKVATDCKEDKPIKIVLNPKGNDGTIFYFENNEICTLKIDFDYLFKIDCKTLSDLLVPTAIDPNLVKQIKELENQIQIQTVKCEAITGKLNIILNEYNNTSYSMTCDKFPLNSFLDISAIQAEIPIVITPKQKSPFKNTGFGGGLAPFSYPNPKTKVTFCLTTEGLTAWQTILGDNNYNAFINGDPNSYTCEQVIKIYNENLDILNNNDTNVYINECTTPFGTKTQLFNEIGELVTIQTECTVELQKLQDALTALNAIANVGYSKCKTAVDLFESFDVSMSLDVVKDDGTLESVSGYTLHQAIGTGGLYDYLTTAGTSSGFFVCGAANATETWANDCTPLIYPELTQNGVQTIIPEHNINVNSCLNAKDAFISELFNEAGVSQSDFNASLASTILASNWLHYTTYITDPVAIAKFANKKIKISLNINSSCGDFCVLVDMISLEKICTDVDRHDIYLTQSPGFNLDRVVDNKKSWLNNDYFVNREFDVSNNLGNQSIRQTDYDVNDERLIINTKEIDLDINIAKGVEHDVWCYMLDNPCILTGVTYCDPCTDCGNKQFQDEDCFQFQDKPIYEFMDGNFIDTESNSNAVCCGDDTINFIELLTTDPVTVKTVENFESLMVSEFIDAKNRKVLSSYPTLRAIYERYLNSNRFCGTISSAFDYATMDQFANLIGSYWVDIIEQVIPATSIWGSVRVYTNTIFDEQKFKYKSYSTLTCGNKFFGATVPSPINSTTGICTGIEVHLTTITNKTDTGFEPTKIPNTCNQICLAQMNWGSEFIGTVSIDNQVIIPIDLPNTNKKACWYNLPATPDFMNTFIECNPGSNNFTITSLKINGLEKIQLPLTAPTITVDSSNINWTYSNNLVISACTAGSTTGITYTNFVDMLNDTFALLSLTDYRAEISHTQRIPDGVNCDRYNGFYIVSPVGVPFEIIVEQPMEFPIKYTNNSISTLLPYETEFLEMYWYGMTCDVKYNAVTDTIYEVSDCIHWQIQTPCVCGEYQIVDTIMIPAENGGDICQLQPTQTYPCGYTDNKTACWYNLPESPEYINNHIVIGGNTGNMTITSLKISGIEQITTPPSLNIDSSNINWTYSNNVVVEGGIPGNTTGITYTNFVDFLNDTFASLCLINYRAEISHTQRIANSGSGQSSSKYSGFYIVSPIGIPFEMIIEQDLEHPLKYTNNSLEFDADEDGVFIPDNYKYGMTCDVIYDNINDVITEVSDCVRGENIIGPCIGGVETITPTVLIPAENGGDPCNLTPFIVPC
jgi:hypothetical protein